MTSAEQAGEPIRDFSSPATWGDVEQVRTSLGEQIADVKTQVVEMEAKVDVRVAEVQTQLAQLETRMEKQFARLETRLVRWSAGLAAAAGVAVIGFLVGILQAVD